jgi:hypothetical protein
MVVGGARRVHPAEATSTGVTPGRRPVLRTRTDAVNLPSVGTRPSSYGRPETSYGDLLQGFSTVDLLENGQGAIT